MKNTHQTGFSLIEVVVTMFILAVGLLGLAGLQSSAIKDGLDVAKRSQVTWIVNELVERMRSNSDGLEGSYTTIAAGVLDCSTAPARQCADSLAGNAVACTAAEIAEFDAWDVFCGQDPGNDAIVANTQDGLNLNQVSITCALPPCTSDSDYSVSVTWSSLAVNSSQTLEQRGTTAAQSTSTITMNVRP